VGLVVTNHQTQEVLELLIKVLLEETATTDFQALEAVVHLRLVVMLVI
jgi:hypothetical protein